MATATFSTSGAASATARSGGSSSVSLTTSAAKADDVAGTLRLKLSGSTWLYRDYAVAFEGPRRRLRGHRHATAGRRHRPLLDGLGDHDEPGRLRRLPLDQRRVDEAEHHAGGGTSYTDTDDERHAVLLPGTRGLDRGGAAERRQPDRDRPSRRGAARGRTPSRSPTAAAPAAPTSTRRTAARSRSGSRPRLGLHRHVTVTLSRRRVRLGDPPSTQGAGTVTISGIDASGLADGSVTLSARASDAAGNISAARTATVTKDTVAPGAPTASYVDRIGSQTDRITGTSEASATITATRTVPSPAGPYTTTAAGGGTYTVNVAAVAGSPSSPISVTYLVTATDAAGNVGAATTVTYSVTR